MTHIQREEYFKKYTSFYLFYLFIICLFISVYMHQYECGSQKITSLSATWVPELELSSLDLAVLAFD